MVAELVGQGLPGGRPERRLPAEGPRGLRDAGTASTHPRADLVAEAVFGLPEVYREQIAKARIVANPGCYPTSMMLGLLPVAGEIDDGGVIVDSKSGVSGAGRTPSDKTHFCAVDDNFKAYSEVGHRHTAEMVQELAAAAGAAAAGVVHAASAAGRQGHPQHHLLPAQGRHEGKRRRGLEMYRDVLRGRDLRGSGATRCPSLAEVQYTNFCRITVREDTAAGLVKVFSVIDNLVKGASGQAVQNMNVHVRVRRGRGPEEEGMSATAAAGRATGWTEPPGGGGAAAVAVHRAARVACGWRSRPAVRREPRIPTGFVAAGVVAGLKESGRPDMGVLAVAPEWRDSGRVRGRLHHQRLRGGAGRRQPHRDRPRRICWRVVMNSGNANACTGEPGLAVARAMQKACAETLGVPAANVAVGSTGIIGVQLDAATAWRPARARRPAPSSRTADPTSTGPS